jgi:hypothetical protein
MIPFRGVLIDVSSFEKMKADKGHKDHGNVERKVRAEGCVVF